MVLLNIEIKGAIDSKKLWEEIRQYGVNVTDLEKYTLVHGEVSMYDSMFVIDICRKYGDITSSVKPL